MRPIQYFPTPEEQDAIDAIAFLRMTTSGEGRTGRATVVSDFVSAALRDRAFLLKRYPELRDHMPPAVSKLLES